MRLAAGLLLDLRGVEKGGDDRGRTYADRDPGFHELRPALFAGVVSVVVSHVSSLKACVSRTSMCVRPTMEAER